eukprot:NODE_322_length_9794_cov_0.486643.p4 type:complete len:358 gc:universal NODE_322_length_9794_cov_0.486643:2261-3334(+)
MFLTIVANAIPSPQNGIPSTAPMLKDLLGSAVDVVANYLQDIDLEQPFSVRKYANWGLLRISSKEKVIQNSNYIYPTKGGDDSHIYVIDNWVPLDQTLKNNHSALHFEDYTGKGFDNVNQRGIEVATIIGNEFYGIAPKAHLHLKKVGYENISGACLLLNVVSAFTDIIGNVTTYNQKAVINLGMKFNTFNNHELIVMEMLIKRARLNNILIVKSAGNVNEDACNVAVSNMTEVITVGAISSTNTLLYKNQTFGSNFGKCVDILGPGSQLFQNSKELGIGTAYAAAHVTGVVSLYLSLGVPLNDIKQALIESGTKNIAYIHSGTPNNIVFNLPTSHYSFRKYDRSLNVFLRYMGIAN